MYKQPTRFLARRITTSTNAFTKNINHRFYTQAKPSNINVIPQPPITLIDAETKEPIDTDTLFQKKRVVVFGVPGAFTPVCSSKHVPSYQRRFEELREKVDEVICVSVNDAHVMAAWRQYLNDHCKDCFPSGKNIKYLADPSAKFTKQAGLDVDLTGANLGVRSKRYSMIVDNGEVVFLNVEDSPGQFQASTAEIVIEQLKQL